MSKYTLALTLSKDGAGSVPLQGGITKEGSSDYNLDEVLLSTSTGGSPQVMTFPFPVTGLKLFYILSDRNVTLTFKSSADATVATITLVAGVPKFWAEGDTALFSGAVATINAVWGSNTATPTDGTLKAVTLFDSTP